MSKNQLHGLFFENLYKSSGRFPEAFKLVGKNNLPIDVPAQYDVERGLSTAVKTISVKGTSVGLSDALRFFDLSQRTGQRIAVFPYEQKDGLKVCRLVLELVLHPTDMVALFGAVVRDDVESLKAYVSKKNIPDPEKDPAGFEAGKAEAHKRARALTAKSAAVKFNVKVSRGGERRLQCTAKLATLWDIAGRNGETLELDTIGNLHQPFTLRSTPRENAAG